jgi:hypothetical protein
MLKRKNKELLFTWCMFTILSCNYNTKYDLEVNDWKKNKFEKSFIKFDGDSIYFFDGIPKEKNLMIGKLTQKNNRVYFNSKDVKFILFDFNLRINKCIEINYKKNMHKKKYLLCKQDAFFDKKSNDSIFKFCFKNYEIFNKNNGVIYFVSKKKGVLGCYVVDYTSSNNIPAINIIMYGEVFNWRYDYTSAPRFTIK